MTALLGIFGGTFNPIHLGHLRAAEEVVERLGLDHMCFVPSARPPHKQAEAGDPIAPAELRLEWTRLAIRDNPRFRVVSSSRPIGPKAWSFEVEMPISAPRPRR